MKRKTWTMALMGALLGAVAWAADAEKPAAQAPPTAPTHVKVKDVSVKGKIEGPNISFALDFTAECEEAEQEIALISGDVVLEEVSPPEGGRRVRYDAEDSTYFMDWPRAGTYKEAVTFAARAKAVEKGPWREASFLLPASQVRQLEVECDRTDLEVLFPGALRVTRDVKDGKLTVTAVLGPGLPFAVRWKPQVEKMDAKLVLASEGNTIALVGGGALRMDTLFVFDIAQGSLGELSFAVPPGLSVTQVRGRNIRDWAMEGAKEARRLKVSLNQPQTKQYALQVLSESLLPKFPTEIDVPVLHAEGGIRAGGYLALGTDSAIQVVVKRTAGLSQVEGAAFPRIILDREHMRRLPQGKAFYYMYASSPYQIGLALDDIVPSFDVAERLTVNVREEDLAVDASLELEVRDAPLRDLTVEVGAGFVVSGVTGEEVGDYTVREAKAGAKTQPVEVRFRRPVMGRTLVRLRLELGKSPLDRATALAGFSAVGAKNERGYVVVAAEGGVELETPKAEKLREVHTGSVPMQVPDAQFAYRFRERGWSLELSAKKRAAGVLAEAFHLVSLGEGVVYGYVVVNYFISGGPVDELRFRSPEDLENVEFVGSDVRRWSKSDGRWTVKLARKVVGDYNMALSYSVRYKEGGEIVVGGVECEGVETQTGYVCVASHRNVKLAPAGALGTNLLEINREEIPANYRLLVNSPVLKVYKYVAVPHRVQVRVDAFERGSVLPVVIELMEIHTELNVGKTGDTESATRVRYKVKNSSSQFLTLAMPKGATVWATRQIQPDGRGLPAGRQGGETTVRLTSSYEPGKGALMIPIRRPRDPNDPITVELEYGLAHKGLKGSGQVKLEAPRSLVQSTYAGWSVKVPEDWAVRASEGGNMLPREEPQPRGANLASVMAPVVRSWRWAFERGVPEAAWYAAGLTVLGVMVLTLALRRSALPGAVAVLAVLALVGAGALATQAPAFRQELCGGEDLSTVAFTQAVNLGDESPLTVVVSVVPAWRRYATLAGAVIVPLAGLACAGLAVVLRRARPALAALAAAAFAYGAAQFPACGPVLGHILTWGLPAALLARLAVGWTWLLRRLPAAAPAAAALMALWVVAGCAATSLLPKEATVERAEYRLKAEKDSMAGELRARIATPEPARIALLGPSAVLLSPERISDDAVMEREGGKYFVSLKKGGVYDVELKFLSPLPEAGEDQVRRFQMPSPVALTNRVELAIPAGGMEVEAPTAIRLTKEEKEDATLAQAVVGPGDDIAFVWRPRARQPKLEKTSFFAEVTSLVRFDTGLAEGRHRIRFQVAQGELKDIRVRVPENMAVTGVEGAQVGAWRFDPARHELEVRLSQPVSGEYRLTLTAQAPVDRLPQAVSVGAVQVQDAARQIGTLGVATGPSVHITAGEYGQPMNVDDFAREAAEVIAGWPAMKDSVLRHAYRVQRPEEGLAVQVSEVRPEIRSWENTGFTVADDRLVYGGTLDIEIAKAGVFSVDLRMPAGYDIDALTAPEVSHWDESAAEGPRTVQVHFLRRLLGRTTLKVALSRPEAELPAEINVPRIEVADALKHAGQVLITSDLGVRLSTSQRSGVSELNVLELGVRQPGAMAFRLLRPDWSVVLKTEIVKPRIHVDFLHVAKVSDGLVRHTHYLRYRLYHAGAKVFEVQAPPGATGLQITGPEMANLKEVEGRPGVWRVELAQKRFEGRPYPLTIRYETKFERTAGEVKLASAKALGVDLQRGHVVVFATERVELAPVAVDALLQPADARSLPREFGAGDLSGAAFCYGTTTPDYAVTLRATRHTAAALLEAEVLEATLQTVINERGESVNRVALQLRVGSKRHLEVRLPKGAQVWSLLVKGRSETPSRLKTEAGDEVVLIPLPQTASGDLSAEVQLTYVAPRPEGWQFAEQRLTGPRFDLPLKNIRWDLYLPEGFVYGNFEGTLAVNEETLRGRRRYQYDVQAYERRVSMDNLTQIGKAKQLQSQGDALASRGLQLEAKEALESAYNYSYNDPVLNEDARVQLHSLMKQQAVVGLVGRRGQLRLQKGDVSAAGESFLGENFNREQAERLQNSLNKSDSENLERITARLIEMQEAAAGTRVQIAVSMPLRGREIGLQRPLQVKPNEEMAVSFEAKPELPPAVRKSWYWAGGLFVALAAALAGERRLRRARREEPQAQAGTGAPSGTAPPQEE